MGKPSRAQEVMAVMRGAAAASRALLPSGLLALALLLGLGPAAIAATPGQVSGTVTGLGAPLVNASVTLIPVTDSGTETGTRRVTLTDQSGRYAFAGVAQPRVKVLVDAPAFSGLVDTYHPDALTFEQAVTLDASSGEVVADVVAAAAGSAAGRVVDLRTGAPVEGARVTLTPPDPAGDAVGAATPTAQPGGFLVSGLPPGPLRVRVRLPAGSPYLATPYRPGAPTSGVIVDGARDTTDLVIGLRRGALVTGTVRDDTGDAVPGATIHVIGCRKQCPPPATSAADGTFRIPGIPPDAGLGVVAWRGEDLLRQWFRGREDPMQAMDLTLGEGEVLDGVDFALVRAAFLTVEVRNTPVDRPRGMIVRLQTEGTTHHQYFAVSDYAAQAPDGAVFLEVGPIPPGGYDLRVTNAAPNRGYLPQRWVTESGPAPRSTAYLAPGQEARAVTGFVQADAGRAPPEPAAEPDPVGQWPGLTWGFLAAGDRSNPFANTDLSPGSAGTPPAPDGPRD